MTKQQKPMLVYTSKKAKTIKLLSLIATIALQLIVSASSARAEMKLVYDAVEDIRIISLRIDEAGESETRLGCKSTPCNFEPFALNVTPDSHVEQILGDIVSPLRSFVANSSDFIYCHL